MLFQELGDQRVLLVFATELIIIAVNSMLAYVTLKRERTGSRVLLSLFYVSQIVGFATVFFSTILISFQWFSYIMERKKFEVKI